MVDNGSVGVVRRYCDVVSHSKGMGVHDFLAYDGDWLISRFRYPRAILLNSVLSLGPDSERETARSHALPVPI